MRKVIVIEFITLDGVIQAGGGPDEDTSGGLAFGGCEVPYGDDVVPGRASLGGVSDSAV
jgi:hypothetical protein